MCYSWRVSAGTTGLGLAPDLARTPGTDGPWSAAARQAVGAGQPAAPAVCRPAPAAPGRKPTLATAARGIRDELALDPGWPPMKLLGQLTEDLLAASYADAMAMAAAEPLPVGDGRYDAYMAALAEHRLGRSAPGWVYTPGRYVPGWVVTPVPDDPDLERIIKAETPPSFACHGVFISSADLTSA